ncbi:MAG TPA: cell envelope integrity EipB family protein [Roseomonas sp.]|nr:cell envelope integrity EipB family protein [Roseomonas sp.]
MRLRDTLAGSTLLPAAALVLGLALPAEAAPAQGSTPTATAQAAPFVMAAHRAAYRLDLDRVRQGGDVAQADGAMLFEVLDACDGWTTRQRLKLNVVDRSGQVVETSSDYSTWESKDGRRLRFTLTQMAQGAVTQRIAGEAELNGDQGGTVRYEAPAAQEVKLPPGTLLPMAHTIRTLEMARAGQRMLLVPLFDGTGEEGAQDTTTILSPWQAPREEVRYPLLKGQGSARMRIAFFSKEANAGANMPEYEVGLRYYANGVADDMNMDFGDFAMNAVMQKLEALPSGC